MIRLSRGDKLVIASHNPGKVREIRELLEPYGLKVIGAADLGLAEPEETGSTFADNAILKAEAASAASNLAALADDFGSFCRGAEWGTGHLFRALGRAQEGFPDGDDPRRKRDAQLRQSRQARAFCLRARSVCARAPRRKFSRAEPTDRSTFRRAANSASATTRSLSRKGTASLSPRWIRRRSTRSPTAPRLLRNS